MRSSGLKKMKGFRVGGEGLGAVNPSWLHTLRVLGFIFTGLRVSGIGVLKLRGF